MRTTVVALLASAAVVGGVAAANANELVILADAQMDDITAGVVRTKFVKAGSWQTLETFWNQTATGFFKSPAGMQIKIYYGYGWLGASRQVQTLDGVNIKKLSLAGWSLAGARMQALTKVATNVTYDVEPGNVAVMAPGIALR